jgi:P-type Mg2+ transporter
MSARKGIRPSGGLTLSAEEVVGSPPDRVLERLGSSAAGLGRDEAAARLQSYGYNEVAARRRRGILGEFLTHFRNPVTLILIGAAIVAGFVGDPLNAIIILAIVVASVILEFTQEYRAGKAADALRRRVATTATVTREGAREEIEVSLLVPGDVVSLSAGDIVPADARVMTARDFFVDQSALTGESFPVEKDSHATPPDKVTDSSAWDSYLFMGTSVTNGTATAVIVKTGNSTQYGEIARKSAERKRETEFEAGLRRFGYLIMQVTFVLVVAVFFVNVLLKPGEGAVVESLLFAVALAVGLTPGLLPMILSINLARGATAMSRKGVIVKRLAAIQNFGSMDVLCSDKTGTLTENRVTVILTVDLEGKESDRVFLYAVLNSQHQTGLKSPLDEAIMKYREVSTEGYSRRDEVPFDFVRKRLSVVVGKNDETILITKGAPEEVARVATAYEIEGAVSSLDPEMKAKVERKYRDLSYMGYRVLAVAYRKVESKPVYSVSDEEGMVFLGFVAFTDPVKETAGESLELLRQAGVKLKILTGDSEIVAGKISQQLGFQVYQYRRGRRFDEAVGTFTRTVEVAPVRIVQSSDISQLSDDALARVVEQADVFARVTPGQKNRIMNALKSNGHIVGFLGDGINDTPSMKIADVSISVTNAVDIAKESAEIILMRNDLRVIAEGVIEGRKTFGNTMKYIQMAVSSNFGNMFSAAGASVFLPFLPMLPIQILLNNLLYSIAQLALPSDHVDQTYVSSPQRLHTGFIRNFMIAFGPVSSIFDFATFGVMLGVFHASESLFQTAWFVESLFTQSLVIFVIRTRATPFFRSKPNTVLVVNILVVLAVSLAIPFTPLAGVFHFVPLPWTFLVILIVFIAVYLTLVELMKRWFYRRFAPAA